jgi:transcription initiation factor TFIIB
MELTPLNKISKIIKMQIVGDTEENQTKKNFKKNNVQKSKKTQKNKTNKTEKEKIWKLFDNDFATVNEEEKDEVKIELNKIITINNFETKTKKKKKTPANVPIAFECIYQKNKEFDLCNLCNSTLIIMEDGFPTCTNKNCGVIYKNALDYSPEWRFYGADDKNTNDPTRCGNPINPLLIESSFGCKILCHSKSSYEMKKIRKWTEWQSMPHKEKSLYEEFQFITIMAQNAGIPKIFIDDAMVFHKDISEQKMFRGLNRDGIKAASIYISCRLNGCPRTAHEISEIFFLDKASATAGCSTAVNILHNIERKDENLTAQSKLCLNTPSVFIERYCSKLNMNNELIILSKFIVIKVEKQKFILDNTPHSIAAGIIYLISQCCNLNINKSQIRVICGVSEVTINKCYKKLDSIKKTLIPVSIIKKYE